MGYNVQAEVDARHHLIVAHEVTNDGHDRAQLSNTATAAREAMGKTKLQAFADRGYINGTELNACEDAGITTYVPKPMPSNAKAEGRFDKSDFIYIARDDEYQCPTGERAVYRFTTFEKNDNKLCFYWDQRLPHVPHSRVSAQPATTGASADGSTKRGLSASSNAWTANLSRWRSEGAPWSTCSARSSTGWAGRTS